MIPKKRMVEQDIAKALCIISVLVCHIVSRTDAMNETFFNICGSAMIFFFMISGFNYKPGSEPYFKTIKKRFVQIIVPMFKYFVAIFVVMGIYLSVRGEIKPSEIAFSAADVWVNNLNDSFFGLHHTPLSGLMIPAWFLKYMMTGFIIYYAVVSWAMSKMSRFYSVCTCLALAAGIFAYFNITLPWGLHTAPAVACFMLIGAMLGRSGVFSDEGQTPKWRAINAVISFAITFTLAYIYNNAGVMGGGDLTGRYGAPEILLAISNGIFGTCWLLALGRLIAKVGILSKFMVFVGRNTLAILVLHMSIARVLFNIFDMVPTSPMVKEFNPASILICIATLAVNCLGIYAFEQIKKRIQEKRKTVEQASL